MEKINWLHERARQYQRFLPDAIAEYLKERGIHATAIQQHLLGWNGRRITIPILGRAREVLGFRYAKSPTDESNAPAIECDAGLEGELYGWDTVARKPRRVVITDSEFDRLALEANRIPAVSVPVGTRDFRREWIKAFEAIRDVYICFARNSEGDEAAKKVQNLVPRAMLVRLPSEVGPNGTVSDFFVNLQMTRLDFEVLLGRAAGCRNADDPKNTPPARSILKPRAKKLQRRARQALRDVPLHRVAERYTELEAEGGRLVGHCPLCADRERSFVVYPAANKYHCSACDGFGDAIMLLMDKESISYKQAVEALESFLVFNEFFVAA